jgi:hypothetical protein
VSLEKQGEKMMIRKFLIGVVIVLLLFILPANIMYDIDFDNAVDNYNQQRKQTIRSKLEKLNVENETLVEILNNTIAEDKHIDLAIAIGFKESRLQENAISPCGRDMGAWQFNQRWHKFDKEKILTYEYACKKFIEYYSYLETIYDNQDTAIRRYNGRGKKTYDYLREVNNFLEIIRS